MPPRENDILGLLILAIPVATITWTVTHEEILRELREWFQARSQQSSTLIGRKSLYLLTCEFCFSFYVSFAAVALMGFRLLDAGWRGFIVGWFSVTWIANVYMSFYARIRLDIKKDRVDIASREKED